MPPKGKSKAEHAKFSQIGQFTSNLKKIKTMDSKILTQQSLIKYRSSEILKLESEVTLLSDKIDAKRQQCNRKRSRLIDIENSLANKKTLVDSELQKGSFSISKATSLKRKHNPSCKEVNRSAKHCRRQETIDVCTAIHGGTKENSDPVIFGTLDSPCAKFPSNVVAKGILDSKPSVVKLITNNIVKNWNNDYYKSSENVLRSLSVYYSHNVMGKAKYRAIRKANKNSLNGKMKLANYVLYPHLASIINSIDIGTLHEVYPTLSDEPVAGNYRSCDEYILRLAKFYLLANECRKDKLIVFENMKKKDPDSFLFVLAIGGDGAPICGMSFLVSFLNVGNRICSSSENYLLFGADVEESSSTVRKFVLKVIADIKYLESTVFTINVNDVVHKVEFSLGELPNDMKMLAFLAGELTNSSYYFTTFGTANQDNAANMNFSYGDQWKPFDYEKRIEDVKKIEVKKNEIEKKSKGNSLTKRSMLTSYISKTLQSRQEFEPLVGQYIDRAKAEPLHLKNNVVKEHFIKIFALVLAVYPIGSFKIFSEIPCNQTFPKFVEFIRSKMNCNFLAKKIITWFNENKKKDQCSFTYRFRGKESVAFLKNFPEMCMFVLREVKSDEMKKRLHQIHFQCCCLRNVISYSVRVENFNESLLQELKVQCDLLFKLVCFYDVSVSPSLWTLCNAVPVHAEKTWHAYKFGLGCNSMEGREQKHQMIAKYAKNTTFKCRWPRIFRHEYIQLIHLREKGYDKVTYKLRGTQYIPDEDSESCKKCALKFVASEAKCKLCESSFMSKIYEDLKL